MGRYTDKQINFIKEKKEKGLTWGEIAEKFNKEYDLDYKKTNNAIRKVYEMYKNIDLTEDNYLKNVKDNFNTRRRNSYIAKENKSIVEEIVTWESIQESLSLLIDRIDIKFHKPNKKKTKVKKTERTLIAQLSDAHIGSNISRKEMGGVNEYNNTIAARRIALFFKQICEYKPQHRDTTDLILILNGDIGTGIIHDQEHAVDLMTKQFYSILSILGQGISYLSQHFNDVKVYCLPDNHMRFTHKNSKDRPMVHKWDSFATMAHLSLKREFTKYINVDFIIPESPYAVIKSKGHKFFATHGDTVFNVGTPSKVVKLGNISAQIDKINNSDLASNGKFNGFFIAHVHTPMIALLDNGSYVFINGCVSGSGSFCQAIGIFGNQPTQQFVEVTKNYIGDCRLVRLKQADNDKTLDSIINFKDEMLD